MASGKSRINLHSNNNNLLKMDEDSIKITDNYLTKHRDPKTKKLNKFTAAQFLDVWNHFDKDNNGYIEEHELDEFLVQFVTSVIPKEIGSEVISKAAYQEMKKDFLDAYDDNEDGRIEIGELSQILPTDEEFLLLFQRTNPLGSSVEFMRVWKKFDKDCSGFIESNELKEFVIDLLAKSSSKVVDDQDQVNYYVNVMLKLFDRNGDGKLQLSEMARLLPVKENYIAKPLIKSSSKISYMELDRIFRIYDEDSNGLMDRNELQGLLVDILELSGDPYDDKSIEKLKNIILNEWDVDQDGMINKKELKMILSQHTKLGDIECKPYSRIVLNKQVKDSLN